MTLEQAHSRYRKALTEVERLRIEMYRYDPDSAVGQRLQAEYDALRPEFEAAENGLPPQHSFNECHRCGRDYNDHACPHSGSEYETGKLSIPNPKKGKI